VIAGDESALPAIGTLLEALPDGLPAEVIIEVRNGDEEHALPPHAGASVRWLHREPGEPVAGRMLEDAVRRLGAFEPGTQVWVGCESTAMRSIRQHLIYDRGLPREQLDTRGYWKYGVENNPDGDKGEEI
jgi:NADPH-dependent ferric siderophore reductase